MTLDAKDLMVGNWAIKSLKSGNGRKREVQIDKHDLINILNQDGPFNYEPIPLTESILKRSGAVFTPCRIEFWPIQLFELSDNRGYAYEFYLTRESPEGDRYDGVIQYLHELQNLVKILSGKDLEFKPETK